MGIIEIEGMEFYGFHGHYDVEQLVGNRFLVDVRIETDCSKAAVSDNLSDALNYQLLYAAIQKEMQIVSNLLENLVHRIIESIKQQFPAAQNVYVKVSKMNPPMGGQIDRVSISMNR